MKTAPALFKHRWKLLSVILLGGLGTIATAACAEAGASKQQPKVKAAPVSRHASSPSTNGVASPVALSRNNALGRRPAVINRSSATPSNAAQDIGDPILARGKALFAKQCVICHGEAGDGQGKFAYLMNPRPRNFQKGKFKLATTQNQIPTDADLLRTISRGMPGSAMPPWGHLPLADLKALVKYVRQIRYRAAQAELEKEVADGTFTRQEMPAELTKRTRPGPPLVIPPEPAFDNVQWFRGRKIYLEACASCHGVDGQPVASAVKFDEEGYPVPPRSFVNGIFKGGSEGHQLYARIMMGMRGTPMPASRGNFSDDDAWDLIHYVQSLARKGAQERAQMHQGTFVAPIIRGSLPAGPLDPEWNQARPLYVALTPLWWTANRIEGLMVQALHNDTELSLRFSWLDPTVDDQAVRQTAFRDAVAIQFSLSPNPPFYMGDRGKHGGVNIWMWKADRQKNIAGGYQDVDAAFPNMVVDMYPEQQHSNAAAGKSCPFAAITTHNPLFITAWGAGNLVANPMLKTPVESLVARGPGTLAGKPANIQLVRGQAVYQRGVWYVQLQRRMAFTNLDRHGDERVFKAGDYLPVSFAIWNGSAGDRDGKKNISIWQKLVIE